MTVMSITHCFLYYVYLLYISTLLQLHTEGVYSVFSPLQLTEQLKDRMEAAGTTDGHEEPPADLNQKLAGLEKALTAKDKELNEKARKVKQASV